MFSWAAWTYREEFVLFLSSPVVHGDRVYGAGCLLDVAATYGSIFCLDAKTGKPIWVVEAIGNAELKGVFSSPFVTADGRHLVIGEGLHYDKDSHLICLDARTGRLHWRIRPPCTSKALRRSSATWWWPAPARSKTPSRTTNRSGIPGL